MVYHMSVCILPQFFEKVGQDPTGRAGRWEGEGAPPAHTAQARDPFPSCCPPVSGPRTGSRGWHRRQQCSGPCGRLAARERAATSGDPSPARHSLEADSGLPPTTVQGFRDRARAQPVVSGLCLPGPGRGRASDSFKPCACVRPLRSAAGAGGTPTHVTYCALVEKKAGGEFSL